MLIELFSAVIAGFAMAGFVLIVRHLTGGRLPKWLAPAAAGLGMIGFAMWSEYTWFERTAGKLPGGVVVIEQTLEVTPLRPWTYAWPYVGRFTAIDAQNALTHPELDGYVMIDVYRFERFLAGSRNLAVVDCPAGRSGTVVAPLDVEGGQLTGAEWHSPDGEDKLVSTLCGDRPVAEG